MKEFINSIIKWFTVNKASYMASRLDRLLLIFHKNRYSIDHGNGNDKSSMTTYKVMNDKLYIIKSEILPNKPISEYHWT